MKKPLRIVLFHATPVAMQPIAEAMERLWPETETVNLLDDALSRDRERPGDRNPMGERFMHLSRYALDSGADGILFTCSAFGPEIDRVAEVLPIPVVKPNEAMFRAAISAGGAVGMLATFAPAVSPMEAEFDAFVQETGKTARLETVLVEGALERLNRGDAETHNRLVAERASSFAGKDAIMLAHFSTSRAVEAVREAVSVPVVTAPDSAVLAMKSHFGG